MAGPWEDYAAQDSGPWADYAPAPKPKPKRTLTQDAAGFMANVNRGSGIGDEIAAGFGTVGNMLAGRASLTDVPGAYKNALAHQRDLEADYSQAHPHMASIARGSGLAPTVFIPGAGGANAFANSGRAMNALRGATSAGLSGAAFSAADAGTPQERLKAASETATNPLMLGLGAVGGSIAPRVKAPKAKSVSVDELRTAKTAAYKAVEDQGIAYSGDSVRDLARGISDEMRAGNISATRHPKAYSMLADIESRLSGREPVSMTQLDQLRQEIYRDVAGPRADDAERFFGQKMIKNLDEFIDSAGPGQVVAGDAERAAADLGKARDLNKRYRKVQTVQNEVTSALDRAASTYAGGNKANAIRQELRPLNDPTSPRRLRNATPEEQKALKQVVHGTGAANAWRTVGKVADPRGLLGASLHTAFGIPTHGLSTAAAPVGMAASAMSNRATMKSVEKLLSVMASGGDDAMRAERELAFMAANDPGVAAVYREARAKLSRAAGVAGASANSSR